MRRCRGDIPFRPRGSWAQEISDYLVTMGQTPGNVIDTPLIPAIWDRSRSCGPAVPQPSFRGQTHHDQAVGV